MDLPIVKSRHQPDSNLTLFTLLTRSFMVQQMYVRVYPWEEKLKRRATRVAHRNNTKLHFQFTNNILGLGNPINFHLAKNSGGALRRVCACVSVVMSPRAAVDRKTLPICTLPTPPPKSSLSSTTVQIGQFINTRRTLWLWGGGGGRG